MKRIVPILFFACAAATIGSVSTSCRHGCLRPGGTSRNGDDESHNMGLNCLNCHSGTGTGDGCFTVGGTVYRDDHASVYENCTIELFSEPDGGGQLVSTIAGDKKGNFYTGATIHFGKGLYPVVMSPEGKKVKMLEPITHGACNSCHGVTTPKIWIN